MPLKQVPAGINEMSRRMVKPTVCIGENKGAVTAKSAFVFATRIVRFLYFLNPKFPLSNHLLGLYSPVCVAPGRNPNCWVSHAQAQMVNN